jgi:hypothetical protein
MNDRAGRLTASLLQPLPMLLSVSIALAPWPVVAALNSSDTTQYYLAFKNRDHTPIRSYVTNRREPYYRWLYGDNINPAEVGHAILKQVPLCRYAGKKADEAQTLTNVPLYEAKYVPEHIQFYRIKSVPFDSPRGYELNRELRKVGTGHVLDRGSLLLK